ncbi:MAG: glycerophosphodiester phosphodiesterase family protein [Pseudomonadota bacterium]
MRPNVDDPGRLIAHRGASRAAPENTLSAVAAAAAQGVWWIEFDVSLLGDGTPVIHHDETLDRCTTWTGSIALLEAGDLPGIFAGRGHGPAFASEPLPTLDQMLDLLGSLDFHANLEIKRHDQPLGAVAKKVAEALAARPWTQRRIIVSSFDLDELAAMRRLMPNQPIAGLWTRPPPDWRAHLDALNAAALHLNFREISRSLLAEAASFGFDVRVYTINEPRVMVAFRELGLTGVITDHPPLFQEDQDWADWSES